MAFRGLIISTTLTLKAILKRLIKVLGYISVHNQNEVLFRCILTGYFLSHYLSKGREAHYNLNVCVITRIPFRCIIPEHCSSMFIYNLLLNLSLKNLKGRKKLTVA